VWCLFEAVVTQEGTGRLVPIFSRKGKVAFEDALRAGGQEIRAAIEKIEVCKAEATVASDKVMIFDRIEKTITCHGLNKVLTAEFGQWILAECRRLLADSVQIHGENHLTTISVMDRLGWLLAKSGEMHERLALVTRVLSATEAVYGRNHPDYWWAHKWVGVAYFRINELEKASSYVLPAAQALEEQLGFKDVRTGKAWNAHGMIQLANDNLDAAKAAYSRALEGEIHLHSAETPFVWLFKVGVAEVNWAQGNLDQALADAKAVSCACEASEVAQHGPKGERTVNALALVGLVLYTQGQDLDDAQACLSEVYSTRLEMNSSLHQDTLLVKCHLALVLYAQGAIEEAEEHFKEIHTNAHHLLVRVPRLLQLSRLLRLSSRFSEAELCIDIVAQSRLFTLDGYIASQIGLVYQTAQQSEAYKPMATQNPYEKQYPAPEVIRHLQKAVSAGFGDTGELQACEHLADVLELCKETPSIFHHMHTLPPQGDRRILWLVRHAQGEHNLVPHDGSQGFPFSLDPPLTQEGAHQIKSSMWKPKVDMIIVSPLRRTLETAQALWPDDTQQVAHELLREMLSDTPGNLRESKATASMEFPHVDFTHVPDGPDGRIND